MAISANVERLDNGSPDGSYAAGMRQPVIKDLGATRTLLKGESGSLVLFDDAAGHVITLPTAEEGLHFDFLVSVSVTSNAHKVITASSAEFLLGAVTACSAAAAMDAFTADGSTHVALSANGTTTGGLIGERFTVRAISSTQWVIDGVTQGSGTLATPFATS